MAGWCVNCVGLVGVIWRWCSGSSECCEGGVGPLWGIWRGMGVVEKVWGDAVV